MTGQNVDATEDAGQRFQRRYRKIFQHSNDAVMIVDLERDEFVDANPAAVDLLGYERDELLDLHPEDIHPDDLQEVREEFVSQVVEEGSGFTERLTCLTAGDDEIPAEVSGAALDPEGSDGAPTRMIAMLRDISDRVERQRELEDKIDRLERFASIVSHDLRTPLTIIKGHASEARKTSNTEHFEKIDEAVDRMDRMLSELLSLARAGTVIDDRRELDLETVTRDAWDCVDTLSATFEVESTTALYGDGDRLREALANLFENAVTHGGSAVTIRVGRIDSDEKIGFYVEDDGDGMPDEIRDTAFDWGETTDSEGTGFGLAIVTEIIHAHGWEIDIAESTTGGSRFEIVIEES
ncbi:PAS domain-containing sensor histidine kinase [Haloplanus salinus]|uniref:histidine kinase n=1 Tax=Haloplanus salinus TaxID=1126245 RepID=A0A368N2Q9_9EURY|nr:PAS domain-containing sensor histidine kinase [Haloplanus salinus]RCU44353.1 PAS domain-containing sensor histidine kinase [Haloplanus salinus]